MYHGAEKIEKFIPLDSCKQSSAFQILEQNYKDKFIKVLDLGCGEGSTNEFFKKLNTRVIWNGLDIENSPEVNARVKQVSNIGTYDGVNIPFEDNYFDLIFCRQVLEHVKKPYELISEVSRVLRTGGVFVGSTSNLEAFHSYSTFNYTPYGFTLLFEDTCLHVKIIRPGIDFFTLWLNRLSNKSRILSRIFSRYYEKQSPVNGIIEIVMKILNKSNKDINLVKLLFGGHFCFMAEKRL